MKPKVGIVRGKFLNKYEMQTVEHLTNKFDITAFGSKSPFHDNFKFPVKKLYSPMDLPEFPYKMQIINRMFVDAHYLFGLEKELQGFDIAHSAETYYRYTQQCLDAKKKGYVKKVVVTVLENIPFNNEKIWGRQGYKQRTRLEADILIALTEKTKIGLITEGADPKKIRVIGSGIDTKVFFPQQKKKSKHLTVLFVGRYEIYKGVFDVLHAAKHVIDEIAGESISFVFVGDGSQRNKMEQTASELGIEQVVSFKTVPYEKIADVYRTADIFIAPSIDTATWQEQYGYMLLEAQASGLPVITTKSGSIPEVVGDAAILVDQKTPEQIADAIKKLIRDPKLRGQYANKSRERAEQVHDSKVISKQIADIYTSLL